MRRRDPRVAKGTPGRRRAVTLAAGSAVAVLASVSPVAVADPVITEEQPLRAAGRAAERVSFMGVLEVRWSTEGGEHSESLLVQGAKGEIIVRGGSAVMASPQHRLVEHGGAWDLLWPVPRGGRERPDPALKYHLTAGAATVVAGRSSRVVEVHDDGMLLERLYLDTETDLLMRREQFEPGRSAPVRSSGFQTVVVGTSTAAPNRPVKVVDAAPRLIASSHLPRGVSAPRGLDEGYERLGLYRRSGVTQVLYSDGLYDLSVFQQEGRLDRSELPGGDRVAMGKGKGWHYDWPGGHLVVWEARGVVHTAVSDAPLDQVLAAIRSLPVAGGSASLVRRLRQVCRALVQPLAD